MTISMIDWGGCRCAFVWRDGMSASRFIANLERQAPVAVIESIPTSELPAGRVRDGWERNARQLGAVWATGLGALIA